VPPAPAQCAGDDWYAVSWIRACLNM
jgi:hypothetical protein